MKLSDLLQHLGDAAQQHAHEIAEAGKTYYLESSHDSDGKPKTRKFWLGRKQRDLPTATFRRHFPLYVNKLILDVEADLMLDEGKKSLTEHLLVALRGDSGNSRVKIHVEYEPAGEPEGVSLLHEKLLVIHHEAAPDEGD